MIDPTRFHEELVDRSVFIAETAIIRGDVRIEAESSVWFGAVIRGDCERIQIGRRTNIQEHCLLHADEGFPCEIGNGVTLGHGAIVHGAVVEDNVMIGMRAVVMNGARIGAGSLIAVGAVVTEGTQVPPRSLVLGIPGKVRGELSEENHRRIEAAAEHYVAQSRLWMQADS